MRRPSTSTVHAPHCPWSQPFFDPVSPRCSRSRSSSEVRVSTGSDCASPLTWRLTAWSSMPSDATPLARGRAQVDDPFVLDRDHRRAEVHHEALHFGEELVAGGVLVGALNLDLELAVRLRLDP